MTLPSLAFAILLAAAGDPAVGRSLFIGSTPLRNGGAPCGACHGLGAEGLAFGATLGPSLDQTLAAMDAESLDGLLDALPFPTMVPVYEGHALTPEERAHLTAYLIPAAQRGPPGPGWRFALLGAAGAAVLLAGLALAARRRKASSRSRLLAGAPQPQGGSR